MSTQRARMLAGELYDPLDAELVTARDRARELCRALNDTRESQQAERRRIMQQLFAQGGDTAWMQPPFYCDYGTNIHLGTRVYFNFNCIVLDVMEVVIGSRTLFGPNVQIYTATHPIDHVQRASGLEYARPVRIGDDVWVGGSAVVCPGVSIGDRSVIGAGSVVTKEIPSDVFAAGNPCKIIRSLQG